MSQGTDQEDPDRRLERLRRAYELRGERLSAERLRFADALAEAEERARDLTDEVSSLEAEREELRREVEGKQGELDRLLNTKTFRYTAGLRRAWSRMIGRR